MVRERYWPGGGGRYQAFRQQGEELEVYCWGEYQWQGGGSLTEVGEVDKDIVFDGGSTSKRGELFLKLCG